MTYNMSSGTLSLYTTTTLSRFVIVENNDKQISCRILACSIAYNTVARLCYM